MTSVVWVVFLALVVIGLAIPVVRAIRRPDTEPALDLETPDDLIRVVRQLAARVDALEGEVDDLSATVAALRDDNEVLQRMIENRSESGG